MRRAFQLLALGLLAVVLRPLAACGEEPVLGEVTVVGERDVPQEEPRDTSAFVTVIRPDRQRYRVSSVPELLKQSAGVDIRQLGGLGSFATVSIRGSTSEQVVILLDGVELNRARSGVVDISEIPLDVVERIEVYRGSSPARFSNAGIGGVVNIVTKKGRRKPLTNFNVSVGSFGTMDLNATRSQSFETSDYLAFVNLGHTDGDFSFHDDNGTPLFSGDDTISRRENNYYDRLGLVLNAGVEPVENTRIEVSENLFYRDQGVPGISAFQSEEASLSTLRNIVSARLRRFGLGLEALDAEAGLSLTLQEQRFKDREGEIGLGIQDNRDRTVAIGGNVLLRYIPVDWTVLRLNTGGGWERFRSHNRLARDDAQEPQKRFRLFSALEQEFRLWDDRLVLAPSVRYDYYRDRFAGEKRILVVFVPESHTEHRHFLSPKAGLKFDLTSSLILKANAAHYSRAPNFSELFGDRGTIVGNPELEPETGTNLDAGFTLTLPGRWPVSAPRLETSVFYSEVDDLILFIQNSQRTSVAQNVSRARIRGAELTAGVQLLGMLNLDAAYTYEDARDCSSIAGWEGNQLPGRPRQKVFIREELVWRKWTLFHEYHYTQDNYLDRANTILIGSRSIHNAGVSFSPRQGLTLSAESLNLTDEEVEDFIGFPLPGRSFFVKVDWTF